MNQHEQAGRELIAALETYGFASEGGCTLKHQGDRYLISYDRNITRKAELHAPSTSPERLGAHWLGFLDNVR